MNSQKHTPGPWKQNADTVWRGGHEIVCHPLNAPKSIADARLIASAPDLLAALEQFTDCFPDSKGLRDFDADKLLAALSSARAAISKATKGEA